MTNCGIHLKMTLDLDDDIDLTSSIKKKSSVSKTVLFD